MSNVCCEAVMEGLRASEGVAAFRDYQGRRHFFSPNSGSKYKEGRYGGEGSAEDVLN